MHPFGSSASLQVQANPLAFPRPQELQHHQTGEADPKLLIQALRVPTIALPETSGILDQFQLQQGNSTSMVYMSADFRCPWQGP